jgi:acetyl esterase/lipase
MSNIECLPPERWKDEVGDIKCALGWLVANAAKYHVDPARISIMGFSADANLAMLAAYSMGDSRLPPSCEGPMVLVCPWSTFTARQT